MASSSATQQPQQQAILQRRLRGSLTTTEGHSRAERIGGAAADAVAAAVADHAQGGLAAKLAVGNAGRHASAEIVPGRVALAVERAGAAGAARGV